MIRIVGIQRAELAENEFVLLQNQGSMRSPLKGHLIMSGAVLAANGQGDALHAFTDDALIPAGMYVILTTGTGVPRWGRTKDGGLLYFAYMGRPAPVWSEYGPVHILHTHHTFTERRDNYNQASQEVRGAASVF